MRNIYLNINNTNYFETTLNYRTKSLDKIRGKRILRRVHREEIDYDTGHKAYRDIYSNRKENIYIECIRYKHDNTLKFCKIQRLTTKWVLTKGI